MKKIVLSLFALLMLFSISGCSSRDEENFNALRANVQEAGYEVTDVFVDSSFEGVVSSFALKVAFDENTTATIPVVLTKSERAARKNCEMLGGVNGIKLPIQSGKIFSYPGKDYPEEVIALITAIVNGDNIPENTK